MRISVSGSNVKEQKRGLHNRGSYDRGHHRGAYEGVYHRVGLGARGCGLRSHMIGRHRGRH